LRRKEAADESTLLLFSLHFPAIRAAALRAMSKLVLFLADGTTLDVPLKRERMTIGRRADNDICLPNLAVSGEHAAVVTILADSFLEDLGSTNGTLVNGTPIAKHFLKDGDQIDIGRHILVYCVDDDAVLSADFVRQSTPRSAVGDLADRVEPAKPFVKEIKEPKDPKPGSGSAMRRDRTAQNALAAGAEAPQVVLPRAPGPPDHEPPEPQAVIKLTAGSGPAREIALIKPQTTLGRGGVQVVRISRIGDAFLLTQVEGDRPAKVNGTAPPPEGINLQPGDVIDLVDTRVEFLGLP